MYKTNKNTIVPRRAYLDSNLSSPAVSAAADAQVMHVYIEKSDLSTPNSYVQSIFLAFERIEYMSKVMTLAVVQFLI